VLIIYSALKPHLISFTDNISPSFSSLLSAITLHLLLFPLIPSKLTCSLLHSLTSSSPKISHLFSSTTISLLQLELARRLEKIAAEKGVQLFLASDVIVADKFAADANNKVHTHSLTDSVIYPFCDRAIV
jgi:hypothetical protein